MAKARLIDFRGGINEKISSHMIGGSQGQNAVDTDLASVRLQGRTKLDTANKADGTFYYDTSDPSTSRWVSTESSDGDAYIEFSSDFAIWNRDLYVALGEDNDSGSYHADGLIVRFLDGAGSSSNVAIAAPASASVTIDEAGWDTQLIASIPEQGQSGGDTGIVITSGTTATNFSRINYQEFQAGYADSGNDEPSIYGGRDIWTRTDGSEFVRAASNGDGNPQSQTNDLMIWSGGSISGSLTNVAFPSNYQNFKYQADGSINNNRAYASTNVTRQDTSGNTYYEFNSPVLGNAWAQSNNHLNSAVYSMSSTSTLTHNAYTNVIVTDSTYTNYYPAYSRHSANTNTVDGVTYDYYEGGPSNTVYYIPTSNLTTPGNQSLLQGYFYRITGGGGTSSSNQSEYVRLRWDRNTLNNYPYSSVGTHGLHVQKFTTSGVNYTTAKTEPNNSFVFISTAYSSTSGRAAVYWGASNFYAFFQCWANGKWFNMQSNGDLQQLNLSTGQAIANTYMSNADVLNIVWFRYAGVSGNNASIPTTTKQFFITTASSTAPFYNFSQQDDSFGTAKWYSASNTLLHTETNLTCTTYIAVNQTGFTDSSGWVYTIPNPSTNTPTSVEPTGVIRSLERICQMYEYASGETRNKTTTVSIPYTFTAHTHTQSAAYSFSGTEQALLYTATPRTYTLHTNTTPIVDSIPETPAFYYDDARTEIWERLYTTTQVRDSDSSFSTNWLAANQSFDNTTNTGYFVRTVINDGNGLPEVSNSELRTTPTITDTVFGTNAEHTPLRLNFSITAPSNTAAVAYRLRRVDDTYDVELGYISESTASFAYSTSTNQITISNLAANTTYRLRYHAYQDSLVQVGSASASKINVNGAEFTTDGSGNHPTITLSTSSGGDTRFLAADFWLRQQILAGNANITGDESYAVIKCFDVLHDTNSNSVTSANSDFIDGFNAAMAGSGVGAGDNTATDAPGYLRFLKESNNFFFGVGTERTAASRYGGTNKKGTFLFVSAYNDPTNWPVTGYVQFDSEITGIASYPGELIVFTENAVYRVTGSRFDQMRKTKLATTEGLPDGNHKTISVVNNYLCWVSQSGICFYNGASVTNLTRGRFDDLSFSTSVNLHAGQYEDSYYVVDNNETGFTVDFSLEGFPVSRVDLKEDVSPLSTDLPVLHYVGSQNRLYTRNGVVEQSATGDRNLFTFKTRAFDGGAFGSLKYVKNITLNGTGSGTVQIYLDGQAVFTGNVFEYDLTGMTFLRKTVSTAFGTTYDFYYNGVLIRQFAGSYTPGATETGSLTEGSTWTIGEGVVPNANGPAWNVTFESTSRYTHSVTSGSPVSMTFTYNYYGVKNNLRVVSIPQNISIDRSTGGGTSDHPTRVYLPASRTNIYGLPVADIWSVEIVNWDGQIDWIDTEYEVLSN